MNFKPGTVVTIERDKNSWYSVNTALWASHDKRQEPDDSWQCSGPTFDVEQGTPCAIIKVYKHPTHASSIFELIFSNGKIGFFSSTTGVLKPCLN